MAGGKGVSPMFLDRKTHGRDAHATSFKAPELQLRFDFDAGLDFVDLAFKLPDGFIRLDTVDGQEAEELATLAIDDVETHALLDKV